MTETTNKAKTTKQAASAFGMPDYGFPKFEMPKFDLPGVEMPEAFREMTEKGVATARDSFAKAKAASEETGDMLQNAYASIAQGMADYNLKVIEMARANTRSAFDYAHELLGVKSPSEFFELSSAQLRKQFDIASAQNNELCALAQETTTKAGEPIKKGVSKASNETA
jgi:phasin